MAFYVVQGNEIDWDPYERYPGRDKGAVTELAGLRHTRANFIRHAPGSKGPRHIEPVQDETFVPVRGTLTMYLGEPPERHEVPVGGLVHVEAGTAQQIVNESDEDLVVLIYGAPPQRGPAAVIDSAV